MARLIWSPESVLDLDAIEDRLSEYSRLAVRDTLSAVDRVTTRLLDYPRIGRAIREPLRVLGVRGTPYLILYRLRGADVEIVRIRHGREDWFGQVEADL